MKVKKIYLYIILFFTAALSFSLINVSAVYAQSQITEYAIIFDTYEIPDYTDAVTVKDGNGNTVAVQNNKIFLQTLGEYIITYPNDNKLNLIVYQAPLNITFTLTETFESEYIRGQKIKIPTALIESDISVYDNYFVVIQCENKVLDIVPSINLKDYFYTLNMAGKYSLIYCLTDVFGYITTKDYSFNVKDQKILIVNDLPEQIFYGQPINLGSTYGYYLGKKYIAETKVLLPTGETEVFKGIEYMPLQKGEYTFTTESLIDNEEISRQQKVTVTQYSTANHIGKSYNITSLNPGVTLPSYASETGSSLYVNTTTDGYLYYNKIIDLRQLSKNDNLIKFLAYSDGNNYMNNIQVTLIDVHDTSNFMSMYWWRGSGKGSYSYSKVKGAEIGAISNESSSTLYGKLRKYWGQVCSNTSFKGDAFGYSDFFNIQYDHSENALYQYISGAQTLVVDFDDPGIVSPTEIWNGFTTGEVYLKLEFTGVRNDKAAIYITELAGEDVSGTVLENLVNESCFIVDTEYAQLPDGAKDYAYKIPNALISEAVENISVDTKLYKGDSDYSMFITDNVFIPFETGNYSLKYTALDNFGNIIEKEYPFEVNQTPNEINIIIPQNQSVRVKDYYQIPDINISGGSGNLVYDISVIYNGKQVFCEDNKYYINELGEFTVNISVTDYIGYVKTASYTVGIDSNLVWIGLHEKPKALRAGQTVILPDYDCYDYNTEQYLEKRVVIGSWSSTEAPFVYNVPDEVSGNQLTIRYYAGYGTPDEIFEDITVSIIPKNITAISDVFLYDKSKISTVLMSEGLIFKLTEDGKISAPYVLPANNQITFGVIAEKLGFESLYFSLVDSLNSQLSIEFEIFEIADNKAKLKINGGEEIYAITYKASKFKEVSAPDAKDYIEKQFYVFDFIYNDYICMLIDNGGNNIAKIKQLSGGEMFRGFESGKVYISLGLKGVSSQSDIYLRQIGNQNFSYALRYNVDFDSQGPMVAYSSPISNDRLVIGSSFVLPAAFACDVLQYSSTVRLTVIKPDGSILFDNVETSSNKIIELNSYGTYKIEYHAVDSQGIKTDNNYFITVYDDLPPQITLSNNFKLEYNKGDTVIIPEAVVSDNAGAAQLYIFIRKPDYNIVYVQANESYKFDMEGSYEIIYSSFDSFENNTKASYNINVILGE